ncbi:hypothetical protein [Herbidospora cretacea]|uniref:hypothetical protein n=1 Tax=Herbidospora cretacea TaxID=28444 RepID=UPI000773F54A|nr:hypothetical protein [Herbidospora cretacea]
MRMAKFFWWAAVLLSLWEFLVLLVSPDRGSARATVVCMSAAPLEFEPPGFPAVAAGALDLWFTLAQPVLLGLIGFWAIRSKGKWGVAALGLVVAVLPVGLSEAAEWLAPDEPFLWRECLNEQLPQQPVSVPWLVLTWVSSPAVMVVLAGIAKADVRPGARDLGRAAAASAVVVAVSLVPVLLASPPENSDGTPRYAVSAGGGRPYVVDLQTGEPVSMLPAASRAYGAYLEIVRDVEPDRFVAALASRSGNHFRLYRLTMNPDGRFTVDERLTPTIRGSANGLAVSPQGRIAYGYSTAAGSFVGTLEREWPAGGWGVQWLDERTLALPGDTSQVSGLATLDVGTGVVGSVPVPDASKALLVLPDGRQVRAVGWPTREVVLHDGVRLVKKLFTIDCGHIESVVAAPTGRHLLVGVDRAAEEMDRSPIAGLPPCGGDPARLVRVDVESGAVTVVPGENEPYVEAW